MTEGRRWAGSGVHGLGALRFDAAQTRGADCCSQAKQVEHQAGAVVAQK